MRRVLSLVLSLVLLWPAMVVLAGTVDSEQNNVPYTALVTVDATAVEVVIDFDNNGTADNARLVSLVHLTGNGIYCVERGTATATGAALLSGQVWTFNRRDSGQPVRRLSCVCAPAETGALAVWADP